MKKVTILILHLNHGGMQKAVASLANMLSDTYKVEIVSIYDSGEKPAYYIDSKVKIKYLINSSSDRKNWFNSIRKININKFIKSSYKNIKAIILKKKRIKEFIKKNRCDYFISNEPFINNILSKYGNKKSIKIAWEHSHHNNDEKYISKLIDSCENIDYLIPVSKSLKEFYEKRLENTKTKVLYIPLCLDEIPTKVSKLNNNNLVMVGRFSKEKAFDDAIKLMKIITSKNKDIFLHIVGDGVEKDNIDHLIKEKNIDKNIIMYGFRSHEMVGKILYNSSLYLMLSHQESFGLTVIESMSYGVPVIAFDSAKGPLEIIEHNKNGIIIENRDLNKMADEIINLLNNRKELKRLGENSKTSITKYSFADIKILWNNFLKKAGNKDA